MVFANGRLYTCDRCGKTQFTKCTGEGEMDGGYTRWNKFEGLPNWSCEVDIGNLCDTCTAQWKDMKDAFKRSGKAKEVATNAGQK